jgi:hypothetical protein
MVVFGIEWSHGESPLTLHNPSRVRIFLTVQKTQLEHAITVNVSISCRLGGPWSVTLLKSNFPDAEKVGWAYGYGRHNNFDRGSAVLRRFVVWSSDLIESSGCEEKIARAYGYSQHINLILARKSIEGSWSTHSDGVLGWLTWDSSGIQLRSTH